MEMSAVRRAIFTSEEPNWVIRLYFPKDLPPTVLLFAAIASTYTFRLEVDNRFSTPFKRKKNTDPMPHLSGSSLKEEHYAVKRHHFKAYS